MELGPTIVIENNSTSIYKSGTTQSPTETTKFIQNLKSFDVGSQLETGKFVTSTASVNINSHSSNLSNLKFQHEHMRSSLNVIYSSEQSPCTNVDHLNPQSSCGDLTHSDTMCRSTSSLEKTLLAKCCRLPPLGKSESSETGLQNFGCGENNSINEINPEFDFIVGKSQYQPILKTEAVKHDYLFDKSKELTCQLYEKCNVVTENDRIHNRFSNSDCIYTVQGTNYSTQSSIPNPSLYQAQYIIANASTHGLNNQLQDPKSLHKNTYLIPEYQHFYHHHHDHYYHHFHHDHSNKNNNSHPILSTKNSLPITNVLTCPSLTQPIASITQSKSNASHQLVTQLSSKPRPSPPTLSCPPDSCPKSSIHTSTNENSKSILADAIANSIPPQQKSQMLSTKQSSLECDDRSNSNNRLGMEDRSSNKSFFVETNFDQLGLLKSTGESSQTNLKNASESRRPTDDGASHEGQTIADPRSKTCCFCWCCCCSCSCMRIRPTLGDSKRPSASNDPQSLVDGTWNQEEKISLEELWKWAESFDFLMHSTSGQKTFREFLHSEYSEENIMFWLACEDIKKEINLEVIEEKARLIYEDFISILSPREVSLDSRVREQINSNMIEPGPHIFDEAQLQIYTLMHRDSYPRFLNSRLYKDLVQEAKDAI